MKSFRSYAMILGLSLVSNAVFAQELKVDNKRQKAIYLDFNGGTFGPGLKFDIRKDVGTMAGMGFSAGLTSRVGSGSNLLISESNKSHTLISMPLMVNYLTLKKKSAFEVGAGLVPYYASFIKEDGAKANQGGLGAIMLNVGYRHIPKSGGLTYYAKWTPSFVKQDFKFGMYSVGIGFMFK